MEKFSKFCRFQVIKMNSINLCGYYMFLIKCDKGDMIYVYYLDF